MNFSRQMKLFDTNIIRFGGIYWCQLHVSLSTIGIRRPLSLSLSFLNQGLRKNKNEFLYQN